MSKGDDLSYGNIIRSRQLMDSMPSAEDFGSDEHVASHQRANRRFKINYGNLTLVNLNWVVTLISSTILWAFVIACAVSPADTFTIFNNGKTWITANLTNVYIFTNAAWAIIVIALAFSKYGNIVLGKNNDEKPAFSDLSWFAMLFTVRGAARSAHPGVLCCHNPPLIPPPPSLQ